MDTSFAEAFDAILWPIRFVGSNDAVGGLFALIGLLGFSLKDLLGPRLGSGANTKTPPRSVESRRDDVNIVEPRNGPAAIIWPILYRADQPEAELLRTLVPVLVISVALSLVGYLLSNTLDPLLAGFIILALLSLILAGRKQLGRGNFVVYFPRSAKLFAVTGWIPNRLSTPHVYSVAEEQPDGTWIISTAFGLGQDDTFYPIFSEHNVTDKEAALERGRSDQRYLATLIHAKQVTVVVEMKPAWRGFFSFIRKIRGRS